MHSTLAIRNLVKGEASLWTTYLRLGRLLLAISLWTTAMMAAIPAQAQWRLGVQSGLEIPWILHKSLQGYYQSFGASTLAADIRFQGEQTFWTPRFQIQTSWIQLPAEYTVPLVAVIHYRRTDLRFNLLREVPWKQGSILFGGGLGASHLQTRSVSFDRNTQGSYQVSTLTWSKAWIPHLQLLIGYGADFRPDSRWRAEGGGQISYGFLLDGMEPTQIRVTHPGGQSTLSSLVLEGQIFQLGIFIGVSYALGKHLPS